MKKGYSAELETKQKLIKEYGTLNVIKVAIGGAMDFIVISKGRVARIIESKLCHSKKYYPVEQERSQFRRIKEFCDEHEVKGELWIKYPNRGWDYKLVDDYI